MLAFLLHIAWCPTAVLQIITFLQQNAHPRVAERIPSVPENVTDQVRVALENSLMFRKLISSIWKSPVVGMETKNFYFYICFHPSILSNFCPVPDFFHCYLCHDRLGYGNQILIGSTLLLHIFTTNSLPGYEFQILRLLTLNITCSFIWKIT